MPSTIPNIEILFVCTGNICRSPMAEALMRRRLGDRTTDPGAEAPIGVSSAGSVFDGRPAEPEAIAAMADVGLDITGHRAQVMRPELIAGADLVIAMEHAHIVQVSEIDPAAFGRTFTFPDLVARAAEADPRADDEPLADWLTRVGHGRTPAQVLRHDRSLEVSDPLGGSKRTFRRCAEELGTLVDTLVPLAFPTLSGGPVTANPHPTKRSN